MKPYLDPLKCSYCSKRIDKYVMPEVPRNPKLIVVGEAPGDEELRQGIPFVGPSGKVLRSVLPVDAIIINAVNVYSKEKPTTDTINIERESHLLPVLAAYPGVPVVSLGQYAAQALMGGKRGESSMASQVLWLYDRSVLFTYHPAYYLRSDKDPRILEHIKAHINSAIAPQLNIERHIDDIAKLFRAKEHSFILDVETSDVDLPFYGTQMVLLGIMAGQRAYQFTAKWLSKTSNVKALQSWINKAGQVVGHNILYDIIHSELVGLNFDTLNWYDTEIAMKDRGHDLFGGFGLKSLAHHLWYAPPWEAKFRTHLAMIKADKEKLLGVKDFPLDELSRYNAADLYYTKRLAEARSIADPFVRLDNDYNKYVKQIVTNGLYINKRKLVSLLKEYKYKRDQAQIKGRKQAHLGKDFNFGSWQQLLPVIRQLAGNDIPNTREQTLMTVFDKHPFIKTLLDERGAEKQVEMLEEIKERIAEDGFIHATLTEHGAETSRTSSKKPNIQNWAKQIRGMVVSRYKK